MSQLSFLDNAREGKNNWWMYLITFIAVFLVMMLGTILPVEILNKFNNNLLNSIVGLGVGFALSLISLYLLARFLHHKKLISLINTGKQVRWSQIFKGGILWAVLASSLTIIYMLLNPSAFKFSFNFYPFLILVIISCLCFPIQAFFEELFFRGYLMQGFGLVFKRALIPVIITSILFGVMHASSLTNLNQTLLVITSTSIMGLLYGIVTLADNGIELAAGSHIANNLLMAIFFNSGDATFSSLPSLFVSSTETVVDLIIFIIAAVLFVLILFWNRKADLRKVLYSRTD
ncbi:MULTISPECIES: CPBP family intramembrane glutamic endopeptidase [Methanobacterium]|uniref:CAAX prenyl protease 2/Lysostaphin resistance protein A-like domain-containing protein n=3 Tax=Methanobacterium formicicum TaxID=2162 RepID=A0A0S4FN01_METFO